LDIEKEIYTTIEKVPSSIAILSKLHDLDICYANSSIACVGKQASEEARELRQDLFKMQVHLFELEFHLELVFGDETRNLKH
jgi:hypothetical protein